MGNYIAPKTFHTPLGLVKEFKTWSVLIVDFFFNYYFVWHTECSGFNFTQKFYVNLFQENLLAISLSANKAVKLQLRFYFTPC